MGIIASHSAVNGIQSGQIMGISTSKSEIMSQISLVHLQDKIPTVSEKVFAKFLTEKFKSMGN
jgi:hypothetical protein